MKNRYTYWLGLLLSSLSLYFLISCNPWDVPTRKSQRDCQTPGGTIAPAIQQRDVTFAITNPTGTIDNVSWNFGDGSTTVASVTASVKHTYAANGTYTVRATLNNSCDKGNTIQRDVTVSNAVTPTVTLQPVTNIGTNVAAAQMMITSKGNATITRYGICYSSTNQLPEIKDQTADVYADPSANTALPMSLTGLQPNTLYYARAYAINVPGSVPGYSDMKQFQTGSSPSVTTVGHKNVDVSTATVIFLLNNVGSPAATEHGIIYGTSQANLNQFTLVNSPTQQVNIDVNLTGLQPSTTYYYRAYAKLPGNPNPVWGEVKSFTTNADMVSQGLVAHLTFTNGSLQDISGNNNHAIRVANPTFVADRKGNANSAIQLNGMNDYFYLNDHPSLRPTALTVSVWIRPNAIRDAEHRMQIFNKSRWGDSSGEMYSSLIKKNEKGPGITFMTNLKQNSGCAIARGWQNFEFSSNPQTGVWHHLVFVYYERSVRMYFNNILLDQNDNLPAASMDQCEGGELKFGAQIMADPDYFSGAMDDIRVYRRALSQSEVTTLFNAAN